MCINSAVGLSTLSRPPVCPPPFHPMAPGLEDLVQIAGVSTDDLKPTVGLLLEGVGDDSDSDKKLVMRVSSANDETVASIVALDRILNFTAAKIYIGHDSDIILIL